MDALAIFTCEKYSCTLTRQACADRQAAKMIGSGGHKYPTYSGCQECEQGLRETRGISSTEQVRHWNYKAIHHKTTQEEKSMGYPNKIDNDKLRRMIAEGKFNDEIAQVFDVHATAVGTRIKRLGLKPNYRRQRVGSAAKSAAPVPVRQPRPLSQPSPSRGEGMGGGEMPGQVIPVTLRLNVEVNVRVSTEGI